MSRHERTSSPSGQSFLVIESISCCEIAAREVGAADGALEQHVADLGEPRLAVEEDHMAGRVAGAVVDLELGLAEGHRVAVVEPAVGREAPRLGHAPLGGRDASMWSIQNGRRGAALRWGRRSASFSAAVPPAWSRWPWVIQIFSSVRFCSFSASIRRGTSPPGSMIAALRVLAHHTIVQFCCSGRDRRDQGADRRPFGWAWRPRSLLHPARSAVRPRIGAEP